MTKTILTNAITPDELASRVRDALTGCDHAKELAEGAKDAKGSATAVASRLGFTAAALGIVDAIKSPYKEGNKMASSWKNIKAPFSQGASIAVYLLAGNSLSHKDGFVINGETTKRLTRAHVPAMIESAAIVGDDTISSLWKLYRETATAQAESDAQYVATRKTAIEAFFDYGNPETVAALVAEGIFADTVDRELTRAGRHAELQAIIDGGLAIHAEHEKKAEQANMLHRGRATVGDAIAALEAASPADIKDYLNRLEAVTSRVLLADVPAENVQAAQSAAA